MNTSIARSELQAQLLELCWRLWGALGVPTSVRSHHDWVIDLEALILFTDKLEGGDARLDEGSRAWRSKYRPLISELRLKRGARFFPGDVGTKPSLKPPEPLDRVQSEVLELSRNRGSQFILRLRACLGQGARTEILHRLLLRGNGSQVTSSEFSKVCLHSKRSTNSALESLRWSGLLNSEALNSTPTHALRPFVKPAIEQAFGTLPTGPFFEFEWASLCAQWLHFLDANAEATVSSSELEARVFREKFESYFDRCEGCLGDPTSKNSMLDALLEHFKEGVRRAVGGDSPFGSAV